MSVCGGDRWLGFALFALECKNNLYGCLSNLIFIVEKLKILERKRLNEIFKSNSQEDDVQNLVEELTADIRENEEKLKEIKKYEPQSDTDANIKANVEIVIAKKLQELTSNLRKGQREYVTKIKNLHGVDTSQIDDYDDDEEVILIPTLTHNL